MTWDDILDRMRDAGLQPVEETYMEYYGKHLAAQLPEFRDRTIRCTYGKVRCSKVDVELFIFPSEHHLQDFVEIVGENPWLVTRQNVAMRFPVCDPDVVDAVVRAL